MRFEWDGGEAAGQPRQHGIDFVDVQAVFDGRARVDTDSPREGEARTATTARRLTDWAAVAAKTEEQLAADTASDPAWDGIPEDWYKHARAASGPLVRPK